MPLTHYSISMSFKIVENIIKTVHRCHLQLSLEFFFARQGDALMLEPSQSARLERSDRLELWALGEGEGFAVEWLLCFNGVCAVFLIYL